MCRLLLLLFLLAKPSAPITLSVSPQAGFAPIDVITTVVVPPHALNRVLCVGIDSLDTVTSSSCWSLDGDKAPLRHTRTFKHLLPGEYTAYANLLRADQTILQARPLLITVLGS